MDNLSLLKNGAVPFKEILTNSLFFPSFTDDGWPIKNCNTIWRDLGINSFVCCNEDYYDFDFKLAGYKILFQKRLYPDEYIPDYWDKDREYKVNKNYAEWIIYERTPHKDDTHGAKRLSLLYICGEDNLEVFQMLYRHCNIAPKMMCWVGGLSFDLSSLKKEFTAKEAPLSHEMLTHLGCVPEWLCLGYCTAPQEPGNILGVLRLRGNGLLPIGFYSKDYLRKKYGAPILKQDIRRTPFAIYYPTEGRFSGRCYTAIEIAPELGYMVYATSEIGDPESFLDYLLL